MSIVHSLVTFLSINMFAFNYLDALHFLTTGVR